MMLSPGYQYEKGPRPGHFLNASRRPTPFSQMLENKKEEMADEFNQSLLFMEFLRGNGTWSAPLGKPTYNVFGWQKPCYLIQEGYVQTFAELMETTNWDAYGRKSGNSKCQDCMVHQRLRADRGPADVQRR